MMLLHLFDLLLKLFYNIRYTISNHLKLDEDAPMQVKLRYGFHLKISIQHRPRWQKLDLLLFLQGIFLANS